MSKKLLIILFLGMFLVSLVSAELTTIDNWHTYEDETMTAIIKDLTGKIGQARLNTPIKVVVAPGYQKVAEFDLWAYEDYNDIIKSIEFYDKNKEDWKNNELSKEFDIKYKIIEEVKVIDWELINYTDPESIVLHRHFSYTKNNNIYYSPHKYRMTEFSHFLPYEKDIAPMIFQDNFL